MLQEVVLFVQWIYIVVFKRMFNSYKSCGAERLSIHVIRLHFSFTYREFQQDVRMLLGTSASLLVTSALLVVTRSY